MQNNNNDTDKFYDTYGKNVSFESFPEEEPTVKDPAPSYRNISTLDKIKRYLAVTLFIAIGITLTLIGGVFIAIFLAIMLIGLLIRAIFFRSSSTSSGFIVIKK